MEKVLWLIKYVESVFAKFCARDFSLGNVPRSGRLVEIDINQIKTLIKDTTWDIADILKISKSIKL